MRLTIQVPKRVTPLVRNACRGLASRGGNLYNYNDVFRDFKWDVPKEFNFAQDIVDVHAEKQGQVLAFHHVSHQGAGCETKWNFRELSENSKLVAKGFNSLVEGLGRSVLVLPRVPEWWLINLAAMRTKGAVLLPGTTLLSAEDIAGRLDKAEAKSIIGDVETARKVEEEASRRHPKHLKHKIIVCQPEDAEAKHFIDSFGWIPFHELVSQNAHKDLQPIMTPNTEIIQIFFTSGTTGAPKMVPHTQGVMYGFCKTSFGLAFKILSRFLWILSLGHWQVLAGSCPQRPSLEHF